MDVLMTYIFGTLLFLIVVMVFVDQLISAGNFTAQELSFTIVFGLALLGVVDLVNLISSLEFTPVMYVLLTLGSVVLLFLVAKQFKKG